MPVFNTTLEGKSRKPFPSQRPDFKGDILVRADNEGDPAFEQAHLADPNRLWPSGTVEYRFWKTFPQGDNDNQLEMIE